MDLADGRGWNAHMVLCDIEGVDDAGTGLFQKVLARTKDINRQDCNGGTALGLMLTRYISGYAGAINIKPKIMGMLRAGAKSELDDS